MEKWFSIRCKLTKKGIWAFVLSGRKLTNNHSLYWIYYYNSTYWLCYNREKSPKNKSFWKPLTQGEPSPPSLFLIPGNITFSPSLHLQLTEQRRSCGLQHIHAPATSVTSHGNAHLSQNCAHYFLLTPTSLFCLHALAAPTTINANGYNVPRHLLDWISSRILSVTWCLGCASFCKSWFSGRSQIPFFDTKLDNSTTLMLIRDGLNPLPIGSSGKSSFFFLTANKKKSISRILLAYPFLPSLLVS